MSGSSASAISSRCPWAVPREAPFAFGYFLGDYMGLADANGDILSLFGSTDGGGPSSIWLRRVAD